ncbi:hypothetical protein C2E21_8713 [Chlorella sorokiniana]|uniref:Uncharacterized protein n=1 Tax=Chlorella sorokiniana TaxID=3076 RepID=A0A2P6TDN9_CHLSO|nr:hypothetical protein C2E21_8713 [Chlorella sorokiniana]|eukprot:PRW20766.1 hypothetical protein C2E21_8713 [Chlorella sorokiniana]
MVVEPSAPGEPPHLHAPGLPGTAAEHGHEGGGLKQKAKEVWHGIKEITPGTKEHRTEFGTDMALGGYRSQMGKR